MRQAHFLKGKYAMNGLESYFYYDESSPSYLRNRVTRNSRSKADMPAGTRNHTGHYQVMLNGERLQIHRIVYELFFGTIPDGMLIDHVDGNPSNNSIENLRLATSQQNSFNRKVQSKHQPLPKGISRGYGGKYIAQVCIGNSKIRKSSTDIDALASWLEAHRNSLHGEFSCNG